jgi:hypothetical protein
MENVSKITTSQLKTGIQPTLEWLHIPNALHLKQWIMSNIINEYNKISHVKWVPCHHGMVRPTMV